MIKRVPEWAELTVARLCTAGGAVVHSPDDDQNGWDRLVEFPQENHPGPADTHPARKTAYVQIKSTTKTKLTCRISLSNALKAAQSMQPWFLVLIVPTGQQSQPEIYAVHLWEDFIRRALKAVRIAENAGDQLNKRQMTFTFSQGDRHDSDLTEWMRATIKAHEPDYQKKKEQLYKQVGYESGHGEGTVTISATSFEEMANNFLGLGSGLPLSSFKFTPSRFGVLSPKPEIDFVGKGTIVVEPKPVDCCEVHLRANDQFYVLEGQVFAIGQPILPKSEWRVRFSTEFFDLIFDRAMKIQKLSSNFNPKAKIKLRSLEAFASLMEWSQKGTSIDLQIWSRGRRIAFGNMSIKHEKTNIDWKRLAIALRNLRSLALGNEDKIEVSLPDILAAGQRFVVLTDAAYAPSMRLEIDAVGSPENVDSLFFYSYADVGNYLMYVLCSCELTEDVLIENRRRFTFGPAKRLDSYVLENPTTQQREQMEKDFQRRLESLEKSGDPIGIGDLLTFSQKSENQSEAAE
jgi:hypothetical protein